MTNSEEFKIEDFEEWFDKLKESCQDKVIHILLTKRWDRFVKHMCNKGYFSDEPECNSE